MIIENILLGIWMFLYLYCLVKLVKEERKTRFLIEENSELVRNNLRLSYLLDAKKDLIEIQEKIIGDYEKKDN